MNLTTNTLSVTDIYDQHKEDSHYTQISGSWESEGAQQSRGSNSDYEQTTGLSRGDETGKSLDERTTWGIEGNYSSLDREQINRGTIGQGNISVGDPDSSRNTELAAINRDINRAQQITKDESETTELYATETSVEDAASPIDTANRWGEQAQDLPDKYKNLPQEVKDNYVKLARGLKALTHSAPEQAVAIGGKEITESAYDAMLLTGYSVEEANRLINDSDFQQNVLANLKFINDAGRFLDNASKESASSDNDLAVIDDNGQVTLPKLINAPNQKQRILDSAADMNAYLEENPELSTIVGYTLTVAQGPKGVILAAGGKIMEDKIAELEEKAGEYIAEFLEGHDLNPETDDGGYFIGGGKLIAGIVLGSIGRKGGGNDNHQANHNHDTTDAEVTVGQVETPGSSSHANNSNVNSDQGGGLDAPNEAFHYTNPQYLKSIQTNGLRRGSYATPNGELSPLQAQIELALPPNRGLPGGKLRIDLEGLRSAGYDIPMPTRVSNTVTGGDGRVYTQPGGGYEMQFDFEIPPEFITIID